MKKFILGFVLGATLSGVGVKAHDTMYNDDDLMKKLKKIERAIDNVETSIMIWCGEQ